MAPPTLEDMRRDALMFAEQMNFDDDEGDGSGGRKGKKHKNKDKDRDREHKKRKKEKKHKKDKGEKLDKVEIINKSNQSDAPRIVIRLGPKKPTSDESMSVPLPDPLASGQNSPETDPLALDLAELHASANESSNCSSAAGGSSSSAQKPLITPIRLKLARSSSGGGYVMTSKGKREQQLQQICDETKTLNIVLPKLDIPLDTETIDLSAGEKSSSGLGPLLFPSAAAGVESLPNDGGSGGATFSTSTPTPPPTMSFNNSLAASSASSGTSSLFNPFGGGTTTMSDQSQQQSSQQQQQQPELAGKDCEVR